MTQFENGDLVSFVEFSKDSSSATVYWGTVIEMLNDTHVVVNTARTTEVVPVGILDHFGTVSYKIQKVQDELALMARIEEDNDRVLG